MTIPQAMNLLPAYMRLCADLVAQHQEGKLKDWPALQKAVLGFFTPAMMAQVDSVVPGWGEMAAYADRQTLHHVTSVLVALLLLNEYQQASADDQNLMLWMVLFHDVTKVARPGSHDYIHAFRSAAVAGKALAQLGFPVNPSYPDQLADWFSLTYNAIVWRDDLQEYVQDNRQLPAIVSGLNQLHGPQAAAVIKAILFHLSIVTDPDYPIQAPLTDAEITRYIDRPTHLLLKVMTLVDGDGWNLFDPSEGARIHQLTQVVFQQMEHQIST